MIFKQDSHAITFIVNLCWVFIGICAIGFMHSIFNKYFILAIVYGLMAAIFRFGMIKFALFVKKEIDYLANL